MFDYGPYNKILAEVRAVLAPLATAKATPETLVQARDLVSAWLKEQDSEYHVFKVEFTAWGPRLSSGPYIKLPDTCNITIDVVLRNSDLPFPKGSSYSLYRPALRRSNLPELTSSFDFLSR